MNVPIALGLNEKVLEPKWFNVFRSAGLGEWLYSGVTHTYPSASCNIECTISNLSGALPGGYAKCGFSNKGKSPGSIRFTE